jgi:hypothetical protein
MTGTSDVDRFTGGGIASRQERLPGPLRDLHRAVLRRFLATGAAPTARWLKQAGRRAAEERRRTPGHRARQDHHHRAARAQDPAAGRAGRRWDPVGRDRVRVHHRDRDPVPAGPDDPPVREAGRRLRAAAGHAARSAARCRHRRPGRGSRPQGRAGPARPLHHHPDRRHLHQRAAGNRPHRRRPHRRSPVSRPPAFQPETCAKARTQETSSMGTRGPPQAPPRRLTALRRRHAVGIGAISADILSPPWSVSHVALRGSRPCRGRVILSGVHDAADATRTILTCGCSLLGAPFDLRFAPRTSRQRHVSHAKTPPHQGFFQTDLR